MRNPRDTRSRLEKLRAMATHPTANPHEAEIALAEIERLGWRASCAAPDLDELVSWYADVTTRGPWLLVYADRFDLAREIVLDVIGHVGRLSNAIAVYADGSPAVAVEWRDEVADALRGSGFLVTVEDAPTIEGARVK